MRRAFAVSFALILGACAATQSVSDTQTSEPPVQDVAGAGFWSDVGTVVTYTIAGAGAGALLGLSALKGNSCQDESCLGALVFAAAFVPVGAVIGAGVGVTKAVRENKARHKAAATAKAAAMGICLNPQIDGLLRACQKDNGPVPALVATPDNAATIQRWFDACSASVERKWAAVRQSELPKPCLTAPVPKGLESECVRRSSLMESRLREEQRQLEAVRSKLQNGMPLQSCQAV